MGIKDRLSDKDKTLFKLVVWACLIVWMVFFFSLSLVKAKTIGVWWALQFGNSQWGQVMAFIVPVWVVFTTLLFILFVARYARKKLGSNKSE